MSGLVAAERAGGGARGGGAVVGHARVHVVEVAGEAAHAATAFGVDGAAVARRQLLVVRRRDHVADVGLTVQQARRRRAVGHGALGPRRPRL